MDLARKREWSQCARALLRMTYGCPLSRNPRSDKGIIRRRVLRRLGGGNADWSCPNAYFFHALPDTQGSIGIRIVVGGKAVCEIGIGVREALNIKGEPKPKAEGSSLRSSRPSPRCGPSSASPFSGISGVLIHLSFLPERSLVHISTAFVIDLWNQSGAARVWRTQYLGTEYQYIRHSLISSFCRALRAPWSTGHRVIFIRFFG
eukprot:scaffold164207_cov28-Tisochrysis_lutea.AAC.3